jgi:hypothetical protein
MAETRARDFADSGYPLVYTNKNVIIGGDFTTNPWQRGTSFTAVANSAYTADRWQVGRDTATAVVDVLKTADAPTATEAGLYTQYCLHCDVTTAEASADAGDYFALVYNVEGLNFGRFGFGQAGTRYVTLSFWHKHTKTGTHCVSFRNNAGDRSYVAEYTQSVTNTWEKAAITLPNDTTGTWLNTNGLGLRLWFALHVGSTYHATANTWGTAGLATSSQVNNLDNVANNFKIALVQLEAGETATQFEARDAGTELALCQRYYYRLNRPAGSGISFVASGGYNSTAQWDVSAPHPVEMRTSPTLTTNTPTSYSIVANGGGGIAVTTIDGSSTSEKDWRMYGQVGSAQTAYSWTALFMNSTAATVNIEFSAEL